ncbi:MAG: PQQ-dependent sugar dehydrogenase [Dehalococcoidia bacterium]|nr:PQQ-dependent sugar dehydrogenase [Dehalococcoidia bacterium]
MGLVTAYPSVTPERPVELFSYPLGGYEVALVEREGVVYGLDEDGATPILDLRDRVRREGSEEGLLSVALDPQFSTNRHVWAYYSASDPRRTVLARYEATADGSIDPASELVVLEQEQPYANHNGGAVRFGPDRMLYLGLGDGGSAGDPLGNAQDRQTLLGSVIRIDVRNASEAQPYAIPSDNPFVDDPEARPEVWAYGLRNPWRMDFDAATGDLWAGDVGQGAWEEIDILRAGENYGWPMFEGDACYQPGSCDDTDGLTFPVAVYDHSGGRCSVTGGVVARNVSATAVEGAFLHGDYCSGELWALSTAPDGAEPVLVASDVGPLTSIAQVGTEIYLLTFGQPLQRLVDQ